MDPTYQSLTHSLSSLSPIPSLFSLSPHLHHSSVAATRGWRRAGAKPAGAVLTAVSDSAATRWRVFVMRGEEQQAAARRAAARGHRRRLLLLMRRLKTTTTSSAAAAAVAKEGGLGEKKRRLVAEQMRALERSFEAVNKLDLPRPPPPPSPNRRPPPPRAPNPIQQEPTFRFRRSQFLFFSVAGSMS